MQHDNLQAFKFGFDILHSWFIYSGLSFFLLSQNIGLILCWDQNVSQAQV